MTDPIRQELQVALHAATFGQDLPCDYHARPKELSRDEPMLCEAIRLVDHPQLDNPPEGWMIDAVRCSDCAVVEIEEPTRGYEEALIQVPVNVSNGVVSVETPDIDDVRVLGFSSATEGPHPLVVDQLLLDASEPGDVGISRWTRVIGMLDAEPPEPLQEHLATLIERSPETPEIE